MTLKEMAEDLLKVWSPPGTRPWSNADVKLMKLLKAIEAGASEQGEARRLLADEGARARRLETGIREALDGMDPEGAPAEILRRALGHLG